MPELLQRLGDWSITLPGLPTLLFSLLLAFVLGKPLAFVYVRTHQGTSYSRSFVQSLVLLPMIITIIMLAVGDSMTRAFGLFGALALIRFRTPIKDSRDTVFLFLAVAIGISAGVQNTTLAVVGTGVTLATAAYLFGVRFGERIANDGVLRVSLPQPGPHDADLQAMLRHHCREFSLVSLTESHQNRGHVDYTWQLRLRVPNSHPALVADVRTLTGAADVSVLVQSQHEEI
jgi:hypothetical protein